MRTVIVKTGDSSWRLIDRYFEYFLEKYLVNSDDCYPTNFKHKFRYIQFILKKTYSKMLGSFHIY